MSTASPSSRHVRWVQHLIDEERAPAVWLLVAGLAGLLFANLVDANTVTTVLHFGPAWMPLERFTADGLLVVFFFVAGLELRHEFTEGSLQSVRSAAVPAIAAVLGMLVPALLFILLGPAVARQAWGVPMATDLPLALAMLAIAGRSLPDGFRAFILSLAIVDDALSIGVIAVVFGAQLAPLWCLATAALAVLYRFAITRSGVVALIVALGAWATMLHTGIHPTVLGVALGLLTAGNTDGIRERWQPVAAYVAVPVFVGIALCVSVDAGAANQHLIAALTVARIVGKPLGIWAGAMLALRLLRPSNALSGAQYLAAGSVAALGFSVSVLFADLTLTGEARTQALVAVLVALVIAAVVALGVLRTLHVEPAAR